MFAWHEVVLEGSLVRCGGRVKAVTWSVGLSAVVVLAGCGASEPAPPTPAPSDLLSSDAASEDAGDSKPESATPVSREVSIAGVELEVAAGPLAVDGDIGVLRLEFSDADGELFVGSVVEDPYVGPVYSPSAVQLIDVGAGTVADVAWSDSDTAATQEPGQLDPDASPIVYHAAYAAPRTEDVAVFVPGAGVFTDIPVIPADEAGSKVVSLSELYEPDATTLHTPTSLLESFVVELEGALSTRQDDAGTSVTIDSDVLFDNDSADLSSAATPALERVVEKLGEADGGTLDVIGHTDDVGTRDHNLDLSERRASAVADALKDLTDLVDFDLSVEGRADDEPAIDDTSEEARAANRRVEISFAADSVTTAPAGELSAGTGPQAVGTEGVDITDRSGNEFHVAIEGVQRLGDYLVGEVELTNTGNEDQALVGVFATGATDSRGAFDPTAQFAATKLTLLDGDTHVYPLDYLTPDRDYTMRGGDRKPLADRVIRDVPAGSTRTVTVVWPAIAGDTVTLDSPALTTTIGNSQRGGPPFRLTDIPVTD